MVATLKQILLIMILYIVKYFENVYKKDLAEPLNFDGIIERFLGEDILTQTKKGLNLIHHF
jgi:hypothetical protein